MRRFYLRFFDFFDKRTDISPMRCVSGKCPGQRRQNPPLFRDVRTSGAEPPYSRSLQVCRSADRKNPVRYPHGNTEIIKTITAERQKRRLFRRKPPLLSILFRTGPGHRDFAAVCRDTQCVRKNIARKSTVITHVPTFTSLIFPANTLITT